MVEPLPLEDFVCLIDRYPLIFKVNLEYVGSLEGNVGLQPEFFNFMYSHKDEFAKAVRDAIDELRGTGAMFGTAILHGIAHMIELYLRRPFAEDHLPIVVASLYMAQNPELWPGMESDLEMVIE